MKKTALRAGVFLALSFAVLAANASAATICTASMNGASENPPTGSPATGFSTLTLNGDLLTVNVVFSGLVGGPAQAAHIHCCIAPPGNAPVIVPFLNFPAVTSGTYTNTFNLNTLLGSAGEASLIAGLNAGLAYVNIHDLTFPSGEIRGFVTATPEPATLLLSAGVLAGLFGTRRKWQANQRKA